MNNELPEEINRIMVELQEKVNSFMGRSESVRSHVEKLEENGFTLIFSMGLAKGRPPLPPGRIMMGDKEEFGNLAFVGLSGDQNDDYYDDDDEDEDDIFPVEETDFDYDFLKEARLNLGDFFEEVRED